MDQLLILLNGRCEFCGYLKLAPTRVSRFICKLRLVHHGLLREAQELDDILSIPKSSSKPMASGVSVHEDSDEEDESEEDDITERLKNFVKRAVRRVNRIENPGSSVAGKIGAIAEERRVLIKEFLSTIGKVRTCGHCKGCV